MSDPDHAYEEARERMTAEEYAEEQAWYKATEPTPEERASFRKKNTFTNIPRQALPYSFWHDPEPEDEE